MTSTLDIITDAYRESNILGIGQAPTAPQLTEALRLLNGVVSSVYGFEVGEALKDWPIGVVGLDNVGVDWTEEVWAMPQPNSRLLWMSSTTQTVRLPGRVSDGARMGVVDVTGNLATYPLTLLGNGRLIEGQPQLVLNTDGAEIMLMYRADLGSWVRLDPIAAATADFVFPPEFNDAFITMLAMRLNPRYGRQLQGETTAWMTRAISQLKARYRQRVVVPCDAGVLSHTPKGYAGSMRTYPRRLTNTWGN